MGATHFGPPIAGAYICPVISVSNVDTNSVVTGEFTLPAGMTATLVGVSIHGDGIASDPAIEVGTSADPNGFVTAVNLSTTVQRPTIGGALASGGRAEIADGDVIRVTATNDANDTFKCANVVLSMFVKTHATNIP